MLRTYDLLPFWTFRLLSLKASPQQSTRGTYSIYRYIKYNYIPYILYVCIIKPHTEYTVLYTGTGTLATGHKSFQERLHAQRPKQAIFLLLARIQCFRAESSLLFSLHRRKPLPSRKLCFEMSTSARRRLLRDFKR